MFKIANGRDNFYQWDLNQKLIVEDLSIDEVHFCNTTDECSLVVKVYEENDLRVANVPNLLLQNTLDIRVYGYCEGSYTKCNARFKVLARTKPADYVYTEVELWNAEKAVEEALEAAKESGDFKGDKGDKGDAGSIKFTVVTELPAEDDGSAIFLVPSGEGEEGNAYDEYIYNNGAWEKIGSASVEVNLDEYVKNTDYATSSKGGVVKVSGRGLKMDGSMLSIDRANEGEIIKKQSSTQPLTPVYLDRAVKTGVTTNTIPLTDEEKTTACNWLGAINKDTSQTENAQVYGKTAKGDFFMIPCADIGGSYLKDGGIPRYSAGGCIPVGDPTYDIAATNKAYVDNNFMKTKKVPSELIVTIKPDGSTDILDFATGATNFTIARRDGNSCLSIGTPTAEAHATTKKYVDDLIAELTARIEALEGVN